jgi:hypothetical protein
LLYRQPHPADVTDVAFAFVTNQGSSTFTTFLSGVAQETATFTTTINSPDDIYQFTGFFDSIKIDVGGSSNAMLMDNLQFNPVPAPAAVWLFGSGLLGMIGIARRKKAA